MKFTSMRQSEASRSVRLLKINWRDTSDDVRSPIARYYMALEWVIGGYEWETRFYPFQFDNAKRCYYMAVELVFLGKATEAVTANLSCRLVDPSGAVEPSAERVGRTRAFYDPQDSSERLEVLTWSRPCDVEYLKDDGFVTVECVVTELESTTSVLRRQPSSNLHEHLGELLRSEAGADVTFIVAGEAVAAHKYILAARSPVFKAQFFGDGEMKDRSSRSVEVEEMEAPVFRAMLGFIYTDTAPEELDDEDRHTATAMAQHLLVAADRYGLDRLRMMCERRIIRGIDADTVATSLALAEQHGCSLLKARCVEFIARGTADNLAEVMATDGFKSLETSNPSLLSELLKAALARAKT